MADLWQEVRGALSDRKRAYTQVFNPEDIAARAVLADLARFCRANETTFTSDERATLLLEGRREVWLRISQYLNLSDDELWHLHEARVQRKVIENG